MVDVVSGGVYFGVDVVVGLGSCLGGEPPPPPPPPKSHVPVITPASRPPANALKRPSVQSMPP